jgi:hypothetical protein
MTQRNGGEAFYDALTNSLGVGERVDVLVKHPGFAFGWPVRVSAKAVRHCYKGEHLDNRTTLEFQLRPFGVVNLPFFWWHLSMVTNSEMENAQVFKVMGRNK